MAQREAYPRQVMGIVNCTPDSFYTGSGELPNREQLRATLLRHLAEGANWLDLGAMSTRPGAEEVPVEEEWSRLKEGLEAVEELRREGRLTARVSVDTFRVEVARRAIETYGVAMINDITGGQYDEQMYRLVGDTGVQYVAMHMRGTPQTMQQLTHYDDVVEEVRSWLLERVERMVAEGVQPGQIWLDPGFGFAKNLEQEYHLVAGLKRMTEAGFPLLVGISRKSMLTRVAGITKEEALPATTALHWELLHQGAAMLRVHDVAAARQTVDLYNYYEQTALQR